MYVDTQLYFIEEWARSHASLFACTLNHLLSIASIQYVHHLSQLEQIQMQYVHLSLVS